MDTFTWTTDIFAIQCFIYLINVLHTKYIFYFKLICIRLLRCFRSESTVLIRIFKEPVVPKILRNSFLYRVYRQSSPRHRITDFLYKYFSLHYWTAWRQKIITLCTHNFRCEKNRKHYSRFALWITYSFFATTTTGRQEVRNTRRGGGRHGF
jgi:hypothetical protein